MGGRATAERSGAHARVRIDGRHAGVLALLALATVLRVLIDRRNPPGVTQDALVYLQLAPHAPFSPFSPTRPNGYPAILRLLDLLPGEHLDVVTVVQHAAGVAVGALVYVLAVRAGVRRGLALTAAAVTLLDAYTVALEQAVLAETMFTLTIVVAVFLVLDGRPGVAAVAAGGLLLGVSCTMRTVGLFVVPVWLAWLVVARLGRRRILVGLAAAVLPVVAYCTMHAVQDAGFSLVGSDGWYLYAKVAPVADCSGAGIPSQTRPLCAGPTGRPFEFYLYDPSSPAYRLAEAAAGADLERIITPENNRLLRRFSVAVIRAHPLSFGRALMGEFFRYLGPSEAQNELKLYATPGTALAWYERWIHITGWMVAAALVAGTALLSLQRRAREAFLLTGTAAALILGAAATSGFNNRYLVPALPFLAAVAALAVDELWAWRLSRRRPWPAGRRFG